MAAENPIQRKIWLKLGAGACRLFRVNGGRGWISGIGPAGCKRLKDGSVLIEAARPIALGFSLPSGDPVSGVGDLQGYTMVQITPEMVGKKVAIYTSVEVKRTTGGRVSEDQANWQAQLRKNGAIAIIANSEESAVAGIQEQIAELKQLLLL